MDTNFEKYTSVCLSFLIDFFLSSALTCSVFYFIICSSLILYFFNINIILITLFWYLRSNFRLQEVSKHATPVTFLVPGITFAYWMLSPDFFMDTIFPTWHSFKFLLWLVVHSCSTVQLQRTSMSIIIVTAGIYNWHTYTQSISIIQMNKSLT